MPLQMGAADLNGRVLKWVNESMLVEVELRPTGCLQAGTQGI